MRERYERRVDFERRLKIERWRLLFALLDEGLTLQEIEKVVMVR